MQCILYSYSVVPLAYVYWQRKLDILLNFFIYYSRKLRSETQDIPLSIPSIRGKKARYTAQYTVYTREESTIYRSVYRLYEGRKHDILLSIPSIRINKARYTAQYTAYTREESTIYRSVYRLYEGRKPIYRSVYRLYEGRKHDIPLSIPPIRGKKTDIPLSIPPIRGKKARYTAQYIAYTREESTIYRSVYRLYEGSKHDIPLSIRLYE